MTRNTVFLLDNAFLPIPLEQTRSNGSHEKIEHECTSLHPSFIVKTENCTNAKTLKPPLVNFEEVEEHEDELEDLLIDYNGDQLPVAAALIKYVDFVSDNTLSISKRKKRCARELSSTEAEHQNYEVDIGLELVCLDEKLCSPENTVRSSSPISSADDQWSERFRELFHYKQQKGHCIVPHNFGENAALARWVKRQRHQYKHLKDCANESNHQWTQLVKERIQALDSIGFVWDCQGSAWSEKFMELQAFHTRHLHCNVPTSFPTNPALAIWVKSQRRQYKMYTQGLKSGMTPERARLLENLGFSWKLRKLSKRARNSY